MNKDGWYPEAQFFLNHYPPINVKATALFKTDSEVVKETDGSEYYDYETPASVFANIKKDAND